MAVSRAEKEQELQDLAAAFSASDTAILVDYKGLNVPQVTELRRQLRGAKANYKVVKNTIARRASKDTKLASLEASAMRMGLANESPKQPRHQGKKEYVYLTARRVSRIWGGFAGAMLANCVPTL